MVQERGKDHLTTGSSIQERLVCSMAASPKLREPNKKMGKRTGRFVGSEASHRATVPPHRGKGKKAARGVQRREKASSSTHAIEAAGGDRKAGTGMRKKQRTRKQLKQLKQLKQNQKKHKKQQKKQQNQKQQNQKQQKQQKQRQKRTNKHNTHTTSFWREDGGTRLDGVREKERAADND